MKTLQKFILAILSVGAISLGGLHGCAVARDQSTAGEYVDDATITAKIKARFIESRDVDAAAINIDTLKGEVQLSGFAKSATEKSTAEKIAKDVTGVRSVKNNLVVRP